MADENHPQSTSFFERPRVDVERIEIGPGIPLGIETVSNTSVGIGGAYGAWGESFDNTRLPAWIEDRLGEPVLEQENMNLAELGFTSRHHLGSLSEQEHQDLEIEVGARFLQAAARANGWEPHDVDAILIGVSSPVADDFIERLAARAGIAPSALKVSVHKACDSSVSALHMALNPHLPAHLRSGINLAEELAGKRILVGGIEGLSRFVGGSRDKNALQLFGNGAGVIGVIPGESLQFITGRSHEVYDEEGLLAVRMKYPHSGERAAGKSLVEISRAGANHIRFAGLMHEPHNDWTVEMAGLMGMVKLFVRTGVQVLQDVYQDYRRRMTALDLPARIPNVAIVHHANLKINKLIEKNLLKEGIQVPMPWLLSDFGNVSAASNMIAFLRKLSELKPGDHVLFDGFGAGTYYDVLAVELGGVGD
jgi:3-oxoacyl-[acyl-carrier-protein] synthase III